MRCAKCGGLMSFEQFASQTSDLLPWTYEGWRCFHCGEIVDPVILLNRTNSRTDMKFKVTEEEESTAAGARAGSCR